MPTRTSRIVTGTSAATTAASAEEQRRRRAGEDTPATEEPRTEEQQAVTAKRSRLSPADRDLLSQKYQPSREHTEDAPRKRDEPLVVDQHNASTYRDRNSAEDSLSQILAAEMGSDPDEVFDMVVSGELQGHRDLPSLINTYADEMIDTFQEEVENVASTYGISTADAAAASSDMINEFEAARSDANKSEFVAAASATDEATDWEVENMIAEAHLAELMQASADDLGAGRIIYEVGTMLVPGDLVEDIQDLVGTRAVAEDVVDAPFLAIDDLAQQTLGFGLPGFMTSERGERVSANEAWQLMVQHVRSLPLQERIRAQEHIFEYLKGDMQTIEALSFAADLLDPQAADGRLDLHPVTQGLDAIGMGGLVRVGGRMVKGGMSVARMKRGLGKKMEAARAAIRAQRSEADAAAAGTTRADVTNEALPVDLGFRSDRSSDIQRGFNPEMQIELQASAKVMRDTVSDLLSGRSVLREDPGVTAAERTQNLGSVNRQLREHVEQLGPRQVTHAKVRHNPDGTADLTIGITDKTHRVGRDTAARGDFRGTKELARIDDRLWKLRESGLLSAKAMDKFKRTALANRSSRADIREATRDIEQTASSVGGLTVRSREFNEAVGKLRIEPTESATYRIAPRLDDFKGTFNQDSLPIGSPLLSNTAVARSDEAVAATEGALRLDNISAKTSFEINSLVRQILGQLPKRMQVGAFVFGRKAAKKRIDRALMRGDEWIDPTTGAEVGRTWTPDELRQMFDLTPEEITAYYQLRQVFDNTWIMRNDMVKSELAAQGFRAFSRKAQDADGNWTTVHEMVAPVEARTSQGLQQHLLQRNVQEVLDMRTGKPLHRNDLSRNFRGNYENSGLVVARMHQGIRADQGGTYNYVLMHRGRLKALPDSVIRFKEGYVPRIYDRGVYFAKVRPEHGGRIDGVNQAEAPVGETLAMFDNRRAAQRFKETFDADAAAKGETRRVEVFSDGEIDPIERLTSTGGMSLWNARRGDRPIPFYRLDGNGELISEKASRLDPLEALQGNVHNLSVHYPRNMWRVAMMKRLQNSAAELGVEFRGLHRAVEGGTPEARAFVERMRKNMSSWLYISTSGERRWQQFMQRVYEQVLPFEGLSRVGVPQGVWWLRSQDPATAAKGLAFHLLLGWFNPVQAWVQMQGASVALGGAMGRMSKTRVASLFREQRILQHMDNYTAEQVPGLARQLGRNETEMTAMYDAWHRSGLSEGLLTTGDYTAARMGFGHDINAVKDFANRWGLIFYRSGEMFNRRFSFATALEDFYTANPAARGRLLRDSEIRRVLADANHYMLGLGRANRAPWQKGLLGVPTQFWQVSTKLAEQLFGRNLTFSQKFGVVLAQMGLYGVAGVPIAGGFAEAKVNQSFTAEEGANTNLWRQTATQGFWGLLFSIAGADIQTGPRGAILEGIEESAYQWMYGNREFREVALGAFGSLPGRSRMAWEQHHLLAQAIDGGAPLDRNVVNMMGVQAVAEITSTFSGASRAWLMHNTGRLLTQSGDVIEEKDWSLGTKIGTALGFQPGAARRVRGIEQANEMYRAYRRDMNRVGRRLIQRYATMASALGPENMSGEEARAVLQTLNYLAKNLHPEDRQQWKQSLLEETVEGRTRMSRAVQEMVRNQLAGPTTDEVLSKWEQAATSGAMFEAEDLEEVEYTPFGGAF